LNALKVGSITLKNGEQHPVGAKKKNAFGFAAQQIEGLKLVSIANSASLEFEARALACVKETRIRERLGTAYQTALKAEPEAATQSFLNAIYGKD
jgi:hypothetical protein